MMNPSSTTTQHPINTTHFVSDVSAQQQIIIPIHPHTHKWQTLAERLCMPIAGAAPFIVIAASGHH